MSTLAVVLFISGLILALVSFLVFAAGIFLGEPFGENRKIMFIAFAGFAIGGVLLSIGFYAGAYELILKPLIG